MNILSQLTTTQSEQLAQYYQMLIEANARFNLTAITDREEVYVKHFEDSMIAGQYIQQGATLVDIGSGAGFPAIPLKILRQDIDITMVDSTSKRVDFVDSVAHNIGISATCIHARAEDFAIEHREYYDVATARAVAPLNTLLEYTAPLVKVGGMVMAYKANDSELSQCQNAIALLGLLYESTNLLQLSNGDPRAILIFRKVSPTDNRYPRGNNKPRKKPL